MTSRNPVTQPQPASQATPRRQRCMNPRAVFAAWICAVAGCALPVPGRAADATAEPRAEQRTVLSEVYTVDRIYRSMSGPSSQQEVYLLPAGSPSELLWITGYEATMVSADGSTAKPQEFMCHSNLDINVGVHRQLIPTNNSFNPRLFTLSQGQLQVGFPSGFGIPVFSDEPLNLATQVLNLNLEGEKHEVRHRVTIHFVRDADAPHMKALFPTSAYGLALLSGDKGYFGVEQPDTATHGPGCLPGANASTFEYADGQGRKFTGHWVVKPGREVNRTLVTHLMRLPFNTKIHYIAVHLHPFAESLELRDLTTGTTLFKSQARNYADRIGLAAVDHYTSPEGIPVFTGHEYELVSTYNNTTDQDQDSMAVMYLYLHDLDFNRQQAIAQRAAAGRAGG